MKKKVLLLGGYGFIGKNFFKKFKNKYKITKYGKFSKNQKITYTKLNKIEKIFDVIIDCSGSSSVRESLISPKKAYDKTIIPIEEIKKYLKNFQKKPEYIYISSAAVYGNSKGRKLKPISNYGKSKLLAEKKLTSFAKKEKIKLLIIRFYSLFGKDLKKQLIWDVIKKTSRNNNFFFGTGDEKRSWMHIDDAVDLIDACLKVVQLKTKIIDAPTKYTFKNKIIIKKVFKHLKYKQKPVFNNITRKGDPSELISKNKIYKEIEWSQKINLDDGIKDYIKWYQKK